MFSSLSRPMLCFHPFAVQIVFNQSDCNLMWHEHGCIMTGLFVNAVHRYKGLPFFFLSVFGHLRRSARPLGVFDSVFLNLVSQTSLYIETPATSQMRHSVRKCVSPALPAQFGRWLARVKWSFLWQLKKKYILLLYSEIQILSCVVCRHQTFIAQLPWLVFIIQASCFILHLQSSTVCCHS